MPEGRAPLLIPTAPQREPCRPCQYLLYGAVAEREQEEVFFLANAMLAAYVFLLFSSSSIHAFVVFVHCVYVREQI
jgi:hypothetical protein